MVTHQDLGASINPIDYYQFGITLYIRTKPHWINYLNSPQEFESFLDSITYPRPIVIGDISLFSKPMIQMLLKVLESYSHISLYSSQDVGDPVILSRIQFLVKSPIQIIQRGFNKDNYFDSPRDYQSVSSNLSNLSPSLQLRSTHLSNRQFQLLSITQKD